MLVYTEMSNYNFPSNKMFTKSTVYEFLKYMIIYKNYVRITMSPELAFHCYITDLP